MSVTGYENALFLTAVIDEILLNLPDFGIVLGSAGWVLDTPQFQRLP